MVRVSFAAASASVADSLSAVREPTDRRIQLLEPKLQKSDVLTGTIGSGLRRRRFQVSGLQFTEAVLRFTAEVSKSFK